MDYELSDEAEQKLDKQAKKAEDKSSDENDPVEQTVSVPTSGSEKDAAEAVQKQYKEKSGLDLDSDVARDIAKGPREKAASKRDDQSGSDAADKSSDADDSARKDDRSDAGDSADSGESARDRDSDSADADDSADKDKSTDTDSSSSSDDSADSGESSSEKSNAE
jgi:hypothetical protein